MPSNVRAFVPREVNDITCNGECAIIPFCAARLSNAATIEDEARRFSPGRALTELSRSSVLNSGQTWIEKHKRSDNASQKPLVARLEHKWSKKKKKKKKNPKFSTRPAELTRDSASSC
jgi:hypothetical protein